MKAIIPLSSDPKTLKRQPQNAHVPVNAIGASRLKFLGTPMVPKFAETKAEYVMQKIAISQDLFHRASRKAIEVAKLNRGNPMVQGKKIKQALIFSGEGLRRALDNMKATGMIKGAKKDMPSFTSQDRDPKAKEVYRALKRDHPGYSAGKKARIAESVVNKS